jgi:glycosyltransferase involved in cell wall biosynthesis
MILQVEVKKASRLSNFQIFLNASKRSPDFAKIADDWQATENFCEHFSQHRASGHLPILQGEQNDNPNPAASRAYYRKSKSAATLVVACMRVWQINLQAHLGGGEVYTAFLTRALSKLGVPTTLFVQRDAAFWPGLELARDTELVPVAGADDVVQRLPRERSWLLGHGPLPRQLRATAHLRTAIAHMPPQGREPRAFEGHELVFGVSGWVLGGLRAAHAPAWDEPLYGVADVRGDAAAPLHARPPYDFDERKLRDRVLGVFYPVFFALGGNSRFQRHPGLTLGIVSRLTPIKQFPEQFTLLAPLLAKRGVNLEIFGAGGYASVRDLKRALVPMGGRARFWGHQDNVAAAYAGLDYLMTGLPEKEALGLNVIEAQSRGLPVLAVAAPPFTETVRDGETGYLYRDPRSDGGADFARLMDALLGGKPRPDPRCAREHLERFSFDAFCERVDRAQQSACARLAA